MEPDGESAERLFKEASPHVEKGVAVENLHLTLRFLGEAEPDGSVELLNTARRFKEINAAVSEVRNLHSATALICSGVDSRLAEAFGNENFLPHITLTRKKSDIRALNTLVGMPLKFTAVSLMRSEFEEGQRRYTPLGTRFLSPEKPFKCVLFDLDGTISDSAPGILGSVRYALEKLNFSPEDESVLRKFLGPPLVWSFKTYLGFSDSDAAEGLRLYRENYNEQGGKYIAKLYPGVENTLRALKEKGIKLGVATVKPEVTAREVLEHFGLTKYFDVIAGSPPDIKHAEKQTVILSALNELVIKPSEEVLMAGDRLFDIESAKALGLRAFGASYGFGGRAELKAAGADYISDRIEEMLSLF